MKTEENKKPSNPFVYPDPMRGAEASVSNENPWQLYQGIQLRDEIAMRAMQGLDPFKWHDYEKLAQQSYKIADSMLKQREL